MSFFVGIDVGTGSARAGVFDSKGALLSFSSRPITMWKPQPDYVEQSSENIWQACCVATREAIKSAGIDPGKVKGIGFDATCSLVLLDADDRPVSVSPSGRSEQNVIVWMDHRAIGEAEKINATRHSVLRYVGGVISPEMQTPKLLWLKKNLLSAWQKAARFFDLPDFLTYCATGDDTRSLCSTVCKWTYLGHRGGDGAGWDRSYFKTIGLGDLAEDGFQRIGRKVRPMGEPVGRGLSRKSAAELGLCEGTAVGVSIIDAHAGGLGLLGARIESKRPTLPSLETRVALIGGTSSCHMAVSLEPRFIRGIWGPYYSAMVPGLWLTEGGQSAAGALIDHIIFSHPAAAELKRNAKKEAKSVYQYLNERLDLLGERTRVSHLAELTRDLHVQPNFHGNRSPLADPTLKGAITGLTLTNDLDDLAIRYLAAIQAVAYGTRHILQEMNRKGYRISTVLVTGGGTKNPVFLREHANITGCKLVLPRVAEAVLLGGAILGAVAAGRYASVFEAMTCMSAAGEVIRPEKGRVADYHNRKYQVFSRMQRDFLSYRRLMS